MEKENINFEEKLKRLQEIVSLMQSDNLSLDESLRLYQEGNEIISLLSKELQEAEEKVEKIVSVNKK